MNDPAIERAVEIKRYADHLENELARELLLFENAERTAQRMQSDLRSISAQALSFFEGVSRERERQKALMSLLRTDGSNASGSIGSVPPPTAHIPIHLAEHWIPAVRTAERPLSIAPDPADLARAPIPEPRNAEFWALLGEMTPNPWAEPVSLVSEQPAEVREHSSPHERTETKQETRREA
jgi:hypothetical protein